MGRDGHSGWSKAADAYWDRVACTRTEGTFQRCWEDVFHRMLLERGLCAAIDRESVGVYAAHHLTHIVGFVSYSRAQESLGRLDEGLARRTIRPLVDELVRCRVYHAGLAMPPPAGMRVETWTTPQGESAYRLTVWARSLKGA